MSLDPRKREAPVAAPEADAPEAPVSATAPAPETEAEVPSAPASAPISKPILLGGEDAMDVDEDVAPALPPTSRAGAPLTSDGYHDGTGAGTGTGFGSTGHDSSVLISRILQPSPYPQHNSGPTSSRFRNALNRVTSAPTKDVEAWQALMTEVNSCYRNISNIHAVDADTTQKLDWVESCYGTLLKHFPYASTYYVTIVEMLLAQTARLGEPDGPVTNPADYGLGLGLGIGLGGMDAVSRRALKSEAKLEHLFRYLLGIKDGSDTSTSRSTDTSSSTDNADHDHDHDHDHADIDNNTTATVGIGGMCVWSIELWLLYIKKCLRDVTRRSLTMAPDQRAATIREATQQAFETATAHAAFCHNNHLLWKDHVAFLKSWVPDASAATNGNSTDRILAQQQMVQLRSVYQRLVTHPMTGLDQLWQEYEAFERNQSEALAQALTQEFAPKYQHARTIYLERNRVYNAAELQLGRLATPPVEETDEDYAAKMEEEYNLLVIWKKRCSYERTNPERLSSSDLAQRIRYAYKEMACVLTRHPECWHMWSAWELLGSEAKKVKTAVAVLDLGQEHVPDSTLLSYAEARVLELHTDAPTDCLHVMEKFLDRSPNTLGFILYQQMVRRYKGIDDARALFAKARRVLADPESVHEQGAKTANPETGEDENEAAKVDLSSKKEDKTNAKRWMVTNRLDPSIGSQHVGRKVEGTAKTEENGETNGEMVSEKLAPGPITWHLYASHASMEHRLNNSPEIAARVYELGLRKHAAFLTIPPFVLRYAQLLLVLGDTMNLRALLTRAVAACEAQEKEDALAALWDMTLQFESALSGADRSSVAALETVERRRRQALMGADEEDVATGGFVGLGDSVLIGAQKATIAEQLIRSESYDVSSRIVNGMSRTVDVLEVMGLWGDGDSDVGRSRRRMKHTSNRDKDGEISGGKSDASYQKRLHFQSLAAAGLSADSGLADGGATAGSKLLSARERLLQGAGGSGGAPGQSSAMMIAIQQAPEWLRPLLHMLPASSLRLPVVAKPPPHLVGMALGMLRQNPMPAERPIDKTVSGDNKRKRQGNGDSSDEENDGNRGGYGSQFRSRQLARLKSSRQNGLSE
jgi:hypothetical protein